VFRITKCAVFGALLGLLGATFCQNPASSNPASASPSPTINANLADPHVFDPVFYLYSNPDFKTATPPIVTLDQATQHWLSYGIKEGRKSRNDFAVRDYLKLNPDIAAAFGASGPAAYTRAVEHYLNAGIYTGRKAIKPNSLYSYTDANGNIYFGNEIVQLVSDVQEYAGAISSMKVRSVEIVNKADAGRLIQTAVVLDNAGECVNPTEGGSYGEQGTSSSVLDRGSLATSPGAVRTRVNAANWFYRDSPYYKVSGVTPDCKNLTQNLPQSGIFIGKYVRVGIFDNPHLISWQSSVTVPMPFWAMNVEAVTGYHSTDLNTFHYIDLRDRQLPLKRLTPVDQLKQEATQKWMNNYFPIILSTTDGSIAVGAVSHDFEPSMYAGSTINDGAAQADSVPGPPAANIVHAGLVPARLFGSTAYEPPGSPSRTGPWALSTTKWDSSFSQAAGSPGTYTYGTFIAVGTRDEVYKILVGLVQTQMAKNFAEIVSRPAGAAGFDPAYYANKYKQFYDPDEFGASSPSDMNFGFDLADLMIYGGAANGRASSKDFSPANYLKNDPNISKYCGPTGYYCAITYRILSSSPCSSFADDCKPLQLP
jgi:hypothetical protein